MFHVVQRVLLAQALSGGCTRDICQGCSYLMAGGWTGVVGSVSKMAHAHGCGQTTSVPTMEPFYRAACSPKTWQLAFSRPRERIERKLQCLL